MSGFNDMLARQWAKLDSRWLPFADAATAELPLGRLLRLSLFQVTVGMAVSEISEPGGAHSQSSH